MSRVILRCSLSRWAKDSGLCALAFIIAPRDASPVRTNSRGTGLARTASMTGSCSSRFVSFVVKPFSVFSAWSLASRSQAKAAAVKFPISLIRHSTFGIRHSEHPRHPCDPWFLLYSASPAPRSPRRTPYRICESSWNSCLIRRFLNFFRNFAFQIPEYISERHPPSSAI